MATMSVYYEYFDGPLVPQWMVIKFGRLGVPWERNIIYVPVESPFTQHRAEDFEMDTINLSITLDKLVIHPERPGSFGIDIKSIQEELFKNYGSQLICEKIEMLIIQMADLEEILQMEARAIYPWEE
ncbi:hypothetical protein [Paenibacillus gansuensis]|uniref:Uncharacterized protein n=1 Tax=Paenibacillus gansuensis TaxID=306542 RepID=A0ABW5PIW2_9BACL